MDGIYFLSSAWNSLARLAVILSEILSAAFPSKLFLYKYSLRNRTLRRNDITEVSQTTNLLSNTEFGLLLGIHTREFLL